MKYCLLLCGMLLSFTGFAQNTGTAQDENPALSSLDKTKRTGISGKSDNTITKTGFATYYAKKFEGRRTSSGAKYRAKKMTAAHLHLPFGTIVTVTNLSNGKSVEVEVNDRGPHSKKYMIDISEGAAKELGFYRMGQSRVEISYTLPEDEEAD